MSVIVKGMEMPKNCIECPLLNDDYGTCSITRKPGSAHIPKDCPLKEIEVESDND